GGEVSHRSLVLRDDDSVRLCGVGEDPRVGRRPKPDLLDSTHVKRRVVPHGAVKGAQGRSASRRSLTATLVSTEKLLPKGFGNGSFVLFDRLLGPVLLLDERVFHCPAVSQVVRENSVDVRQIERVELACNLLGR